MKDSYAFMRWRQLNSKTKQLILIKFYLIKKILYPFFTQIRFSALNTKPNFVQSPLQD